MRTKERQVLAEEIAHHKEIEQELASYQRRYQELGQAVYAASAALDDAEKQVEIAQGAAKEAIGRRSRPALSLRDARAAEEDAREALEIARAARDEIPVLIERARQSLLLTPILVKGAAKAVIKAADPNLFLRLARECIAARGRYFSRLQALDHLAFIGALPLEADRARSVDNFGPEGMPPSPWLAAIEALATDPDAPLPDAAATDDDHDGETGGGETVAALVTDSAGDQANEETPRQDLEMPETVAAVADATLTGAAITMSERAA